MVNHAARSVLLLALILSLIAADPYGCIIFMNYIFLNSTNPTFSLDATQGFKNDQICVYNVTFPREYAVEIRIDGWYLNAGTVEIKSTWIDTVEFNNTQDVSLPGNSDAVNETLQMTWPPTYFQLTIHTYSWGLMSLLINVTIKPISEEEPAHLNTTVNQQPYFFQFTDWPVDTAVTIHSASSGQLAVLGYIDPNDMGYEFMNIFVYYGSWNDRQLLGTLDSLMVDDNWIYSDYFYVSCRDTLTFYRAMNSGLPATMMVNDYENMRNLTYFELLWSPLYPPENTVLLDASRGLAALTVLDGPNGTRPIFLENVKYQICDNPRDCPKYINYTSPIKLLAGGMVRDYDSQGTLLGTYRDSKMYDDRTYPQFIPGVARTFVLEEGMAYLNYTINALAVKDSDALDGRNGFVMSDNYPFEAIDQYSEFFVLNSVDGNEFTFEYTILEEAAKGHALHFSVTNTSGSSTFRVDLYNVTTPAAFNVTALYMNMTIVTTTLDAYKETSTGTYIPYRIYSTSSTSATDPTTTVATSPSTTTTTVATTSPSPSREPMASWKIALICLGVLLLIIVIILLILFLRYRIRRGKYRKFWSTMSGVLPIAVKVDEWELGDKQLEIFEDKELGRGAFGIVYEGELYGDRPVDRIIRSVQKMTQEEKEQKKVAVKRLPLNADNQARLDFTEEISFMKKLGYHPHILGMIGCITVGTSTPSIVLDYCQNGDLLSWVRKNKYSTDMKSEQLLSIAWQISDGLCYLKSLNLIHRDLAARNILLTEELVAKISDFGLCRKPENSEDSATYLPNFYVSRGGRLPVKWLAPESLRDFRFSFKTDLWSYGVILWEMYTFGDVPFGDVNPLNLYELLDSGERLPQGAIPESMYKLMVGCWDAVPGKRTPIEKIKEILHEMMLSSNSNNYGYLTMSADDDNLPKETEADSPASSVTDDVEEINLEEVSDC